MKKGVRGDIQVIQAHLNKPNSKITTSSTKEMNPRDYPPAMKIPRRRLVIIEEDLTEKNLWSRDLVDFGERWSYVARLYSELVYNIMRTPHPDEECMKAMGIEDEIPTLFKRVGLEQYYAKRPDTYLFQTMEFLCTLRVDKVRDARIGRDIPTKIRFYLGGNLHEMTLEQLNECFGAPIDRSQKLIREHDAFDRDQFWFDITDTGSPGQRPYTPNNAKVSSIRNPVMRYLEKILQHSVFSRAESGSVNCDELYVMWCFLNGVKFNMAYYFVLKCERVIERKTKFIYLGGMVTLICNHLGVEGHGNLEGDDLDISKLIKTKVLVREAGRLWYRQDKGPLFPLPNKKLTTVINTKVNLAMRTKAHNETVKKAEVLLDRGEERRVTRQKYVRRAKRPLIIREEEEEEEEEEEGRGEEEEEEEEEEMVGTEDDWDSEEREAQEEENMRSKAGYRIKYGDYSSGGWQLTEDEWEKSQKKQEEILTRQEKLLRRQEEMFELLHSMHEVSQNVNQWHISEGHWPAPPPPPQ